MALLWPPDPILGACAREFGDLLPCCVADEELEWQEGFCHLDRPRSSGQPHILYVVPMDA